MIVFDRVLEMMKTIDKPGHHQLQKEQKLGLT